MARPERLAYVGQQVQARRAALMMTQQQLAEVARVGDNCVTGFERGQTCPQPRNRLKIDEALQWPAGTLDAMLRGEQAPARVEPSLLGVVAAFVKGATICLDVLGGSADQKARDATAAIQKAVYELEMMLAAALPDASATYDDTVAALRELHSMRA